MHAASGGCGSVSSSKIVESYQSILDVLSLKIRRELEQAFVDDRIVDVIAHDNPAMFTAAGLVLGVDTNKISLVDGDDGPALRDGELHLGVVVLRVHASFMRADGINAVQAQALGDLITEIFIQVQLDFQLLPHTLQSTAHRKPVHWPR